MVSHFERVARLTAAALCASVALAGCGIKGPLKPPPKPEAAKTEAPAKQEAPATRSP
jgi:predicted small lipoprotein YifL